jgi:hypothetical protein
VKLDDLKMDVEYTIRLGRYVEGLDQPKWGEWRKAKLYLQRVKAGKDKGKFATIAVANGKWAEYGVESYSHTYKVFESEGYYMQIKELLD